MTPALALASLIAMSLWSAVLRVRVLRRLPRHTKALLVLLATTAAVYPFAGSIGEALAVAVGAMAVRDLLPKRQKTGGLVLPGEKP